MVESKESNYTIPFSMKKLLTPEEQTAAIRAFKSFDKTNDGFVEHTELKSVLADMGKVVTEDWVKDIFARFDVNKDGQMDFQEFLVMLTQLESERKGNFGSEAQLQDGSQAAKIEGKLGSHHTYEAEERNSIARLFNNILDKDEYVGDRFPIEPESDDLWHVLADGVVMIRVINAIDKDAVDMRTVNKGKNGVCNIFEVRQNIDLAMNLCKGRIKMTGVNPSAFLEKKPHYLLGMSFQLARQVQTQKIALKDHPEIYRLLKEGEELKDLMNLPPEEILIRWINFHLRKAGQERQVSNLGKDLADSQAMLYVLNQLDKQCCPLDHLNDEDLEERANHMIANGKAIQVAELTSGKDWIKGNPKSNSIWVAEVFNTRHGLEELNEQEAEEFEKAGIIDDDIEGTREERQFRLWINSLEIEDVYINNLFEDVRDGQVLLKVIHKINPNVVEWNRVEKNPNNAFKVGINCKVAFDAIVALKCKTVGIGAQDIQNGNKKLTLALVWQLMRIHYLQLIHNKTDQEMVKWANQQKGNEGIQIANFKDKNLADGLFLINLCAAIEPRMIDWDLVKRPAETDDEKQLNAKYAISLARKLGATIFMIWDDVLNCNAKMMLIFVASIYEMWQELQKQQ